LFILILKNIKKSHHLWSDLIETSIKADGPISPDTINANQSCYFRWIFETANFFYKNRNGREQ